MKSWPQVRITVRVKQLILVSTSSMVWREKEGIDYVLPAAFAISRCLNRSADAEDRDPDGTVSAAAAIRHRWARP